MNRRHFMRLSAIAVATVLVPTDTVAKSDCPVIDMNGSDTSLELRNYSGGITIKDTEIDCGGHTMTEVYEHIKSACRQEEGFKVWNR